MIKKLGVFIALNLVVSCTNFSLPNIGQNTKESLSKVPRNSILSLRDIVQIPPDRDRIYFQSGLLASSKKIKVEQAHCELEMKYKEARVTSLEPEDFRIVSVDALREEIEQDSKTHKNKVIYLTTRMYLRSEQQTEILSISCSKIARRTSSRVTLADFNSSVGKFFRIKYR